MSLFKTLRPLAFAGLLLPLALPAQAVQVNATLTPKVQQALKKNKIAPSSLSLVTLPLTGPGAQTIFNADVSVNPASTMKLITTYAALELLGPTYQWKTEFYTDGTLKDGVLNGNLYLKGGGDPKLNMEKLWLMMRDLRANGVLKVTGDLQHAVGAQVAHHQPQLLHVQLRVATALEVEVAVEHPVLERAVGVELGLPLVGGAQQLQGGVGGDQLHGGGRVHRHVRIEDGLGARAGQRQGHQRQGGGGDLVLLQGLLDLRREGRIDLDGLGRQGEGQEQAGEGEWAKGLEQGHQRRSSRRRRTTGSCMAGCSRGGLGKMRALCRKQPPGAGPHAARAKRRRTC